MKPGQLMRQALKLQYMIPQVQSTQVSGSHWQQQKITGTIQVKAMKLIHVQSSLRRKQNKFQLITYNGAHETHLDLPNTQNVRPISSYGRKLLDNIFVLAFQSVYNHYPLIIIFLAFSPQSIVKFLKCSINQYQFYSAYGSRQFQVGPDLLRKAQIYQSPYNQEVMELILFGIFK
ncbi:hypothetical protein pb186bvf_004961 [Paramecium bursaria]